MYNPERWADKVVFLLVGAVLTGAGFGVYHLVATRAPLKHSRHVTPESEPNKLEELPAADLARIYVWASKHGNLLTVELINSTNWQLREITVEAETPKRTKYKFHMMAWEGDHGLINQELPTDYSSENVYCALVSAMGERNAKPRPASQP